MVTLRKAQETDCPAIHRMQVQAFAPLLAKYQDHASNPAAESVDDVVRRFRQSFTDYVWIEQEGVPVGLMRVCDFGDNCRISPICVLPAHQGQGIAQQALRLVEQAYPNAHRWTLDTILQEEKLCHLYEKMGYRRTGEYQNIKPGMDLVFYQKEV